MVGGSVILGNTPDGPQERFSRGRSLPITEGMAAMPTDPTVLLAVVEAQNEIASAALDLDAVMSLVCAKAKQLTGADGAVVEIADGDDMVYRAACGGASPFVGRRLPRAGSLSGRCMAESHPLICDDAATDPRVDRAAAARIGVVSMLCVPLIDRDGAVGVLKVISGHRRAFGERDEATLNLLSGLIAAQMRHAQVYARAEEASREDALTGLGNARAYHERVGSEVARAIRHGRPVTLCFVELVGAEAGDAACRRVARALATMRAGDLAYRIDTRTFALLLPETTEADAEVVLRRLHATLAVRDASGLAVSVVSARKQARTRDVEVLEDAVRDGIERARRVARRLAPAA
jgi:GAF domain-containing protein